MFLFNFLHRMNVRLGLACDSIQLSGTLEVAISDHYPVFTFLSDYNVPDSKEDTIIKYRLINDITLRKFRYALENNIEINNPNTNYTAKIVFSNFLTSFTKLYERYFPIKQLKLTRRVHISHG